MTARRRPRSALGHSAAAGQPRRRSSGVRRRSCRGPGRGQPADRACLRARATASASWTFAPARAESRSRSRPPHRAQRSLLPTAIARACRSSRRAPQRAGARIETRLLSPPREFDELADWREAADLVLVDAPCSGSGTWRRNPEGRWRLTPERLDRLVALQQRLARHRRRAGQARAVASSMPSARFCPAKGQGRLTASSATVHRGLVRRRPLPAGVRTVRAGC